MLAVCHQLINTISVQQWYSRQICQPDLLSFLFQGSNPLLVRLDYEVTKMSGRFSKVHLQFSEEFEKVIAANKKVLKIDALTEDDSIVEVILNLIFSS